MWWIRRSVDPRLTRYPKPESREDRARAALLTRYPQHVVERAYRKAHWLRTWRTACERGRLSERELAERIIVEARRVEGEHFSISVRSLQAWHTAYHATGPSGPIQGVEALLDGRAVANRVDDGDGTDRIPSSRDPRAVEYFYGLYHIENKLSVAVCHDVTLREAKRHGCPALYKHTGREVFITPFFVFV